MYIIIALKSTMHPHFMAIFTPYMWKFLRGSLAGINDQDGRCNTDLRILGAILVIFGTAHCAVIAIVPSTVFLAYCVCQTDRQTDTFYNLKL